MQARTATPGPAEVMRRWLKYSREGVNSVGSHALKGRGLLADRLARPEKARALGRRRMRAGCHALMP